MFIKIGSFFILNVQLKVIILNANPYVRITDTVTYKDSGRTY